MKRMQLRKFAVISALIALAATAFVPAVLANPISPVLNWSPNPVPQGSPTTATFGVKADADCPTGQTFTGTITVTEPDGVSVASYSVSTIACGTTSLTVVYPTGFTGTAGTSETGTYAAVWAGTTSALVGGVHPTFSVTDNFVVPKTTTAPEFAAPAMFVAAVGLVLVALAKKGNLLHL